MFPPFLFPGRNCKISVNSSLNAPLNPFGPGDFFFMGLKIMNSISLMAIGLFMLSILSWLHFVVCGLQGIGPFLLSCQV